MIFLFTNIILDIAFGTAYWILKKTKNGIYYLVWKDKNPKLLTYNKDIITNLIKKTQEQEQEINLLKKNLEFLKININIKS